jgi:transcription elongation factor Elf1
VSAAAKVSASERGQCLLCGKLVHVVSVSAEEVVTWDLCKGCGLAFAEIAERVAASVVQVLAVTEAVIPAGQLQLQELEDGTFVAAGDDDQ